MSDPLLQGWKIEQQNDLLGTVIVTAPNGYVATTNATSRNPENVLRMLALAALAAPTGAAPEWNGWRQDCDAALARINRCLGTDHDDLEQALDAICYRVGLHEIRLICDAIQCDEAVRAAVAAATEAPAAWKSGDEEWADVILELCKQYHAEPSDMRWVALGAAVRAGALDRAPTGDGHE